MRVLHVLDHSVPLHSGYSFRTLAILREQRCLGWETIQLTSAKHTVAALPVEEVNGLTFYRTLPTGGVLERLPVFDQMSIIIGVTRRLGELIPRLNPDLIHAHSPSLNGLAALAAARKFGLPVVYEVRALWEDGAVDHGLSTEGDLRYRATRGLETWVLKRADAVTTICEGLRDEIARRGIAGSKITVIPNAVDASRFTPCGQADPELARSLGLEGHRVLGFIGSFYAYEGLALLLRALPKLLFHDQAIRLLLVGGGPEEGALREQAQALGLADKVVFAGRIPHELIHHYYGLVDLFVYPRERTRVTQLVTPLKPLEAMAYGKVVVASDVDGHRELIRAGRTGFMFRAGDPDSLAEIVLDVLGQPQLAASTCAAARRFVEDERCWAASVARYEGVYLPLIDKPGYGVVH